MQVTDIKYDNELFSSHNLLICYLQGGRGDEINVGNNLSVQQVKAVNSNTFYNVYASYNEVLQFDFEIAKLVCGVNDYAMSDTEINDIMYWLNRKENHKLELIFDDNSFDDCYFNGTFTSINPIMVSDKVVGFHLTFLTDAPYSHLPAVEEYHQFTSPYEDGGEMVYDEFSFDDTSNEEGYVYGVTTIVMLEDGDLRLRNLRDDEPTVIKNCVSGETITLNGVIKYVSTDSNQHTTLSSDFNYRFPRILNKRGNITNTFTSNLSCEMTIEYTPIRKVGGFIC